MSGLSVLFVVLFVFAIAAAYQMYVNKRGGCPKCGTPVPMFRTPTSMRQFFWGGWTCVECGTEMDRRGRELPQP